VVEITSRQRSMFAQGDGQCLPARAKIVAPKTASNYPLPDTEVPASRQFLPAAHRLGREGGEGSSERSGDVSALHPAGCSKR
jgi:hypothetical protein